MITLMRSKIAVYYNAKITYVHTYIIYICAWLEIIFAMSKNYTMQISWTELFHIM